MAHSMMTVNTHVVSDANHSWVTRESPGNVSMISFWFNPVTVMTMRDVVDTIESQIGAIKIGRVTVRGMVIQRSQLDGYNAAELLKDNESFNCHLVPLCCTLL